MLKAGSCRCGRCACDGGWINDGCDLAVLKLTTTDGVVDEMQKTARIVVALHAVPLHRVACALTTEPITEAHAFSTEPSPTELVGESMLVAAILVFADSQPF